MTSRKVGQFELEYIFYMVFLLLDTIDSLLRFADSVKGISLCIINLNKARPDIVSIVLEVLRRKCIYFYIFDESQESYPSSKDVERLLQVKNCEVKITKQLIFHISRIFLGISSYGQEIDIRNLHERYANDTSSRRIHN